MLVSAKLQLAKKNSIEKAPPNTAFRDYPKKTAWHAARISSKCTPSAPARFFLLTSKKMATASRPTSTTAPMMLPAMMIVVLKSF